MLTNADTRRSSAPVITLTPDEKRISEGRADFMKRFFSVAVSVGFASKISDLSFFSSFTLPTTEQSHQLVLLIFAMIVVVGSWEFYFSSITKRPLIDWPRFVTDIVIVSLYIVLLLSVKSFDIFFMYLLMIIFLYIIWDVLSMRVYPLQYGIEQFSLYHVFGVYLNGSKNRPGHGGIGKAGPFITLWWFLVFIGLFAFHLIYHLFFYSVAVATALTYIFYRVDQTWPMNFFRRAAWSALIVASLFLLKYLATSIGL